jgi:hypothetical protein
MMELVYTCMVLLICFIFYNPFCCFVYIIYIFIYYFLVPLPLGYYRLKS